MVSCSLDPFHPRRSHTLSVDRWAPRLSCSLVGGVCSMPATNANSGTLGIRDQGSGTRDRNPNYDRPMNLTVATTNDGNLREIRELLAGLPVVLQTLGDFPSVPVPEETGATFAENAR